jgi:hypothetical protein
MAQNTTHSFFAKVTTLNSDERTVSFRVATDLLICRILV